MFGHSLPQTDNKQEILDYLTSYEQVNLITKQPLTRRQCSQLNRYLVGEAFYKGVTHADIDQHIDKLCKEL